MTRSQRPPPARTRSWKARTVANGVAESASPKSSRVGGGVDLGDGAAQRHELRFLVEVGAGGAFKGVDFRIGEDCRIQAGRVAELETPSEIEQQPFAAGGGSRREQAKDESKGQGAAQRLQAGWHAATIRGENRHGEPPGIEIVQ